MKGYDQFADQIFTAVQGYVAREFEARAQSLKSFCIAENVQLAADTRKFVDAAIAALPVPKEGTQGLQGLQGPIGLPGKDVDLEMIRTLVSTAVAAIPLPKDGDSGERGPQGDAGPQGSQGERGESGKDADQELVRGLITSEIAKAVAAIPVPKDGETGPEGPKGDPGPEGIGIEGKQGPAGERGADMDTAVINDLRAEIAKAQSDSELKLDSLERRFEDKLDKQLSELLATKTSKLSDDEFSSRVNFAIGRVGSRSVLSSDTKVTS